MYSKYQLGSFARVLAIQNRYVHRNHPGHKPKPPATLIKPTLRDRYLDKAIYPPVKPKFPPGNWNPDYDPKLAWHYYAEGQKFHSLKTIQERLSVLAYLNIQQTLDDLKVRRTRYYPIYQLSSLSKTPKMLLTINILQNLTYQLSKNYQVCFQSNQMKLRKCRLTNLLIPICMKN